MRHQESEGAAQWPRQVALCSLQRCAAQPALRQYIWAAACWARYKLGARSGACPTSQKLWGHCRRGGEGSGQRIESAGGHADMESLLLRCLAPVQPLAALTVDPAKPPKKLR